MHQLCCMKKVANSVCKMHDFCLKIEEFLLFCTCCFKLTTNHESKFASTCKMCFPNTCKTVLCSGNQFSVKIHIFLFLNFVPFFMELPNRSNRKVLFIWLWLQLLSSVVSFLCFSQIPPHNPVSVAVFFFSHSTFVLLLGDRLSGRFPGHSSLKFVL